MEHRRDVLVDLHLPVEDEMVREEDDVAPPAVLFDLVLRDVVGDDVAVHVLPSENAGRDPVEVAAVLQEDDVVLLLQGLPQGVVAHGHGARPNAGLLLQKNLEILGIWH